jgi:predicted metal-dependent peptidase
MKFEKVELTPTQAKKWDDTRCALLWSCPAFTHIWFKMMNNANSKDIALFTKEVPTAATDGDNLILNPDTFFTYDLDKRLFIVAHEILHCILDHCGMMHRLLKSGVPYSDGTRLPYDQKTMNIATDLVINAILIESGIGSYDKDWLYDPAKATGKDSSIDVYRAIYKKPPPGGQGFDEHLAPGSSTGKDSVTATSQRSQAKWDQAVIAGATAAKAMGRLPAGLERFFTEMLEPQVEWKEHIKSMISRRLGTGGYDWRKPDRRLITRDIYGPARSGFGAGTVVVACDTSGSIGEKELNMFLAEMAGIMSDVRPRELIVMWCDAEINRVDYCDEEGDIEDLRCKGTLGGGGTSFIPVFDEIAKRGLEPDALVYLTDLMGTFPAQAPEYPVIWGHVPIYPTAPPAFGDVVEIPKQAT